MTSVVSTLWDAIYHLARLGVKAGNKDIALYTYRLNRKLKRMGRDQYCVEKCRLEEVLKDAAHLFSPLRKDAP